jgi:group I intron endonuclease
MMKEKSTQYFVYHIINNINNKVYVGIASNCKKRWLRHISTSKQKIKHAIHWAILKYGSSNFTFKEIEACENWETACIREIFWIKTLKEQGLQLYNETDGGDGSLGIRRYGKDNPNFGKEMKPHVKEVLLKTRRKLTDEQILEIKTLFETGNYTQTNLSKQFNVSLTQIHRIVRDKSWGDKEHDTIITKKNLSKEDVLDIRSMYATGNYTQKEIAAQYNCSINHINRVINGKKWKDV